MGNILLATNSDVYGIIIIIVALIALIASVVVSFLLAIKKIHLEAEGHKIYVYSGINKHYIEIDGQIVDQKKTLVNIFTSPVKMAAVNGVFDVYVTSSIGLLTKKVSVVANGVTLK